MPFKIKLLTILSVVGLLSSLPGYCAGGTSSGPDENEEEAVTYTQGQLAAAIVRSLGLEDEIGFDRTVEEYMNFLHAKGIAPLSGWDANAEVTKEVLAVVVVQTLGFGPEVRDPTNPSAYVAVLDDHGFSLEDVRKVLSNIFVLNVVTEVFGNTLTLSTVGEILTPISGF